MSHTNVMTMSHTRRIRTVVLCALAALVASAATAARAQAQAVTGGVGADWTTASSTAAGGTLLGVTVTLSGSRVTTVAEGSVVDGRSPYFASSAFSPALPKSDMIQIFGPPAGPYPANPYTIKFDAPVKDPLLHIGSLGSKLVFSGTTVTKRSGNLVVAGGTTLSSYPLNATPAGVPADADGTVKLSGTFGNGANGYPPVSLTTSQPPWANWASPDGILIQLVALVECTDWTSVSANDAGGTLLGAHVTLTRQAAPEQHYPLSYGSVLDRTWTYFAGAIFSPALPASDVIHVMGPRDHGVTYHYAIGGLPTTRPILHLGSLASAIGFVSGPTATALSRESADFQVAGSTVTGKVSNPIGTYGLNDVSGTVMLSNATSAISFDITNPGANFLQEDGIYLQVCAAV
jgi:hypothetical protein